MGKRVSQTLKFISPLQSLTIFPKEVEETSSTPREKFLPKFKVGLEAEKKAKEFLLRRNSGFDDEDEFVGKGWEERAAERERVRAEKEDQFVEKAYDRAVAKMADDNGGPNVAGKGSTSKYQFVGVIQPPGSEKKVKWYARKRPSSSKWNVRLLHANRDAIVRDLFVNGKVDVFAKYANTGKLRDVPKEGEDVPPTRRPLIQVDYNVKKRNML